MNRLIIVGSPRSRGRSAFLAETIFETFIEEFPGDELALAPVSELDIAPWDGRTDDVVAAAEREAASAGDPADGADGEEPLHPAFAADDDMREVYELLNAADELSVVCPVYFSGAPAQFKALLDRLQPYYWIYDREAPKRPLCLHVIGEGGDPHGFSALVSEVKSAFAVAGFQVVQVLNWVGRIKEDGEITGDPEPIDPALFDRPSMQHGGSALPAVEASSTGGNDASRAYREEGASAPRPRPKLDIAGDSRNAAARAEERSRQGSRPKRSAGKKGGAAFGEKNDAGKRSGRTPRPAKKGNGKRRG